MANYGGKDLMKLPLTLYELCVGNSFGTHRITFTDLEAAKFCERYHWNYYHIKSSTMFIAEESVDGQVRWKQLTHRSQE